MHLSLVFGISHNTALRYTTVAERLLSDELEQPRAVEPADAARLRPHEPAAVMDPSGPKGRGSQLKSLQSG